MTNTSDRRRKRRSAKRKETKASSSFPLAILIVAFFLLLVPLPFDLFNPDLLLTELDEASSQQTQQRRFLLNNNGGESLLDIGIEENVWKRQLRGQKQDRAPDKKSVEKAMHVDGDGRRLAVIPRYADKHHFEECVGKTVDECQVLIDYYVTNNPDQFNDQTTLLLEIRKMREWTDETYYKVVLRTNLDGTEVYGIFDDGMVYYPWLWRVEGKDKTIGPWDCSGSGGDGAYLSPAECCAMIQAEVVWQDDNQHYLACFVEEPVGGPNNPEREDRAIVVIDSGGEVVRSPVAH